MRQILIAFIAVVCVCAGDGKSADLQVGSGKPFARIEDALAAAKAGDTIVVFPLPKNQPYEKVALQIRTAKLTLRAADKDRVKLSGKGYDYSGAGKVPRAIVQFNAGADGCVLEGFELSDAHNQTHNGAGVRINQANDITVRRCDIHDNDMGIMSNGDGTDRTGREQLIESCRIHSNGSDKEPGFNHNLYLGGTSVRLIACEVFKSTTGHNVKSRAHQTFILNCHIHDAANREIDLVDSADTVPAHSDAVLVGNIIVKDFNCTGNRGVIHFGQDGKKEHDGTLWLAHNSIITPYITPVVTLSSPKASARLYNNLVHDGYERQHGQVLIDPGKAGADAVAGSHNYVSSGFAEQLPASIEKSIIGDPKERSPMATWDKGDFQLRKGSPAINSGRPLPEELTKLLGEKLFEYGVPLARSPRKDDGKPDIGAYESR